jgi:hypothetical protein
MHVQIEGRLALNRANGSRTSLRDKPGNHSNQENLNAHLNIHAFSSRLKEL